MNFSWSEPPKAEGAEGKQMSVQDALRIVAETSSLAGVLPKWITRLPLEMYVPFLHLSFSYQQRA